MELPVFYLVASCSLLLSPRAAGAEPAKAPMPMPIEVDATTMPKTTTRVRLVFDPQGRDHKVEKLRIWSRRPRKKRFRPVKITHQQMSGVLPPDTFLGDFPKSSEIHRWQGSWNYEQGQIEIELAKELAPFSEICVALEVDGNTQTHAASVEVVLGIMSPYGGLGLASTPPLGAFVEKKPKAKSPKRERDCAKLGRSRG